MRTRIWRLVVVPCLMLVLSGLVAAAPPAVVEVPKPEAGKVTEIRVAAGCLAQVSAEPASEWQLLDDVNGADLRTADNGKSGFFAAPAAGRYRATVTAPDKSRAVIVFVVGNPPPGPAPGPKPPEPPPADPLKERLRAAYAADAEPAAGDKLPQADGAARKKAARAGLAEVYRLTAGTCKKPEVETPEQLIAVARGAAANMVGPTAKDKPGALAGVRGVVAEELAAILPDPASPLAADQRDRAAELFRRAAEALDGF